MLKTVPKQNITPSFKATKLKLQLRIKSEKSGSELEYLTSEETISAFDLNSIRRTRDPEYGIVVAFAVDSRS
jgi:hypothetical protein